MEGKVTTGDRRAADFVAASEELITDAVGFSPYPGTLNLEFTGDLDSWERFTIHHDDDICEGITFIPCRVAGIQCAVIRPHVPDYPEEKAELLSPVRLRDILFIDDGDDLSLRRTENIWPPSSQPVLQDNLDSFDAIVFDLDQTLVELDVDWELVQEEIDRRYGSCFGKRITEYSMTELYDVARTEGIHEELMELLSTVEGKGIDTATMLPLSKCARTLESPVTVCTANSVDVAWKVLEKYNIADNIESVVGRETLTKQKPSPEPLDHCLESVNVEPGNALFVGDSRDDARAAQAAGTSYLHPKQIRTT